MAKQTKITRVVGACHEEMELKGGAGLSGDFGTKREERGRKEVVWVDFFFFGYHFFSAIGLPIVFLLCTKSWVEAIFGLQHGFIGLAWKLGTTSK